MENNLKIYNIRTVYEGSMTRGEIDNSHKKGHSDAFVYFLCGETDYYFDGKSFTAREGTVVFLPKASSYKMNVRGLCNYIVADFDFEDSESVRSADLFTGMPSTAAGDFERLFHVWHKSEPWSECEAYGELYRIYSACIRSQTRIYGRAGELYSAAIKYVLENYASESLRITDIAEHVGITEVHLRRIFKSHSETSPMRYVNYLRLEKAKRMLIESNCTVSEVARISGFADPYYFSREFKKHVGISPSEFRAERL